MARAVVAAAAALGAAAALLLVAALLSDGSTGVEVGHQVRRLHGNGQDDALGGTRGEGLYFSDYFGEDFDEEVLDEAPGRQLAEEAEDKDKDEKKEHEHHSSHHSHHKSSSSKKKKVHMPMFMEGSMGTTRCPPNYTRITSEATCRIAAKALKKEWNEVVNRDFAPAGCYTSNTWVNFNTHRSGGQKADDATVCEKVGARKVVLGGFPSEVNNYDRSFLNGMFVERPGTAYQMNKRPTYWKDKGQLYIYHCKKYSDWRVGVASDWEHNLAGDCMSFAYTSVGDELFDPSHVQFTHIWDGSAWTTLTGAGVVMLEPEPNVEMEDPMPTTSGAPMQVEAFGYTIGQKVFWLSEDEDVPKNTTGTVIGFTPDRVRVKFPVGTWRFVPEELQAVPASAQGGAADKAASGEAECGHCYYHSDARVTAHEKGGCKPYSRDPTKCVNQEESETCSITPDSWWGPCTTSPDVDGLESAMTQGPTDHTELGPKERAELKKQAEERKKAEEKLKKAEKKKKEEKGSKSSTSKEAKKPEKEADGGGR